MMLREMMRAKIHGAVVTDKDLHYTGSLGLDGRLMDAIGILENEKIQVINLVNGERMWTYAIRAEAGLGQVALNGGMAHKGEIGDRLLVISYALVDERELATVRPKVLVVGGHNTEFEVRSC